MKSTVASQVSADLLREVYDTLVTLGYRNTILHLQWIRKVNNPQCIDFADRIFEIVGKHFGVNVRQIIKLLRPRDKNFDIICILTVLLKDYGRINQSAIAKKLNRSRNRVTEYLNRMKNLSDRIKSDVELMDNYNILDGIIKENFAQWKPKDDPEGHANYKTTGK